MKRQAKPPTHPSQAAKASWTPHSIVVYLKAIVKGLFARASGRPGHPWTGPVAVVPQTGRCPFHLDSDRDGNRHTQSPSPEKNNTKNKNANRIPFLRFFVLMA